MSIVSNTECWSTANIFRRKKRRIRGRLTWISLRALIVIFEEYERRSDIFSDIRAMSVPLHVEKETRMNLWDLSPCCRPCPVLLDLVSKCYGKHDRVSQNRLLSPRRSWDQGKSSHDLYWCSSGLFWETNDWGLTHMQESNAALRWSRLLGVSLSEAI